MAQAQTLSRNQRIVLDIIEKAKGPLKAYSILFNVQKKGINAPQQIYRASLVLHPWHGFDRESP